MAWTLYVLVSRTSAETYVGITTDLERRLEQHNGRLPGGARTTTRGRPWSVGASFGPFESRAEAQRLERQVKRRRGPARLAGPAVSPSGPEPLPWAGESANPCSQPT